MVLYKIIYPLAILIIICFVTLVLYFKYAFTYWRRKGLFSPKPSIPFGNTMKLFTAKFSFGEQFAEFYRQLKRKGLRHGGIYMFAQPFYIPVDPEITKHILQKDFQHFVDRGFYVNEEIDPLSGHLFSLEGTKWRNLRMKLTATFTSSKMKMMFETLVNCTEELNNVIDRMCVSKEPVDIKDILARFTTDIISSCAFGLESNSLKNPDTKFRFYGKRIIENSVWENLKMLSQFAFPKALLEAVRYKISKPDVEKFIMGIVKKTVDYRENNNIFRKDFLHLLIQLKNKGTITDDDKISNGNTIGETYLTLEELAAQVFVFFLAGYETSSTTMTFALYELSKNLKLQEKLREEIRQVLAKHNNKMTYEAIMEMTYMDNVINGKTNSCNTTAFKICFSRVFKVVSTSSDVK